MDSQVFDIVIVGAGISGIAAAKFYLDIHPQCRLVVLERDTSVGGTFNSNTQWPMGAAEYSDRPMARPPKDDVYYDFFKAKYTTQYLEDYIDHHVYAGQSLRHRIRFDFEVQTIRKHDSAWVLIGQYKTNGEQTTIHTEKLVVASGLASTPSLPSLPFKERFEGPILHQESFGQSSILSTPSVQCITVIGAGKSSADMAYASIKAGKTVSWIIRTPGTGPGFFLSPKGKGPYKNAFALGSTRLAAGLMPSFFNPDNRWTNFIHGTSWGSKILSQIMNGVDKEIRNEGNFDARPAAKKGFEKLAPHSSIFWQNQTGGLLNRPDFWETIAENAQIYEGEILELDKKAIRLHSREEIPTDALLCGTGWSPSLDFFDEDLLAELDLPHNPTSLSAKKPDAETWTQLEGEADRTVLAHFPQLAHPPPHYKKPVERTPYRLYNGMAPLNSDSIVFVGHVLVGSYFRAAECQAVWATAYLDKQLSLPLRESRQANIALVTAWCRRRYLSNGEKGNWMVFELIKYTDRLLEEVGLSSHRKGWFADLFVPCVASDLSGLKDEYVQRYYSGDRPKVSAVDEHS